MNILITGGTGFIGSNLLEKLSLSDQNRLFCLVRNTSNTDNLKKLNVNIFEGDLCDKDSLKDIPQNIDVVCHLAAEADYSTVSHKAYIEMVNKNVSATKNLFLAVINKNPNLKKFIHFSSLASMGFQRNRYVDNQTEPSPFTFYGKMKLETEIIIRQLCQKHKTSLVILRPSLVYGQNDYNSDFLQSVKLINKGIFPVFGKGNNIMSPLIHVDDLVEICIRFMESEKEGTYICANNEQFTVNYYVETLRKVLDKKRGSIKIPVFLGLIGIYPLEKTFKLINKPSPLTRKRIIDLSVDRNFKNIHKELDKTIGYHPIINLKMGASLAINWYQENKLI